MTKMFVILKYVLVVSIEVCFSSKISTYLTDQTTKSHNREIHESGKNESAFQNIIVEIFPGNVI